MSLSSLFGVGASALRAALAANDLLCAEGLIARHTRDALNEAVDQKIAAILSPAMASLVSGPRGAITALGDTGKGLLSRTQLYVELLEKLLNAGNIAAAGTVVRKEEGLFNVYHGNQVMAAIIRSGVAVEDKLRLLGTVLAGGHNNMNKPQGALQWAELGGSSAVIDLLASHGIKPPAKIYVPMPLRSFA